MLKMLRLILDELGIVAHFTELSDHTNFTVYLEKGRANPAEDWPALRNHTLVADVQRTVPDNPYIARVTLKRQESAEPPPLAPQVLRRDNGVSETSGPPG